jgi:hypothetical protein
MAANYKEAPWWWYISVLVFSFVLGLVVVIKENITLPVWGYIVSLILGIFIAPFVSVSNGRPRLEISNIDSRAPSSTHDMETVLLPTTCPRCWLV